MGDKKVKDLQVLVLISIITFLLSIQCSTVLKIRLGTLHIIFSAVNE